MTNALIKYLAIATMASAVSFPVSARESMKLSFITDESTEEKPVVVETDFADEDKNDTQQVEIIIDDGSSEGKRAISFSIGDDGEASGKRIVVVNDDGEEIEIARSELIRERVDELRARIEEGDVVSHELKIREFETELEMAMRELDRLGADSGALAPEDLHSWLILREEQRSEENFWEEVLIPVVAMISIFGMPVFIVGLVSYFRFRRRREVTHAIGDIVAKNPSLDNDRLEEIKNLLSDNPVSAKAMKGSDRDLRRGAILTAIGSGILLYQLFNWNLDSLLVALIPLFIGLAYLWLHRISPKTDDQV